MEKNPSLVLVVAVALLGPDGRVLMQRRRHGAQHGGLWEFPGGKVEMAETLESALVREIDEELGVTVAAADLVPLTFAAGESSADGRQIVILLYTCRNWAGEPVCLDAEELGWFRPAELPGLSMPPLDYPLADALILSN